MKKIILAGILGLATMLSANALTLDWAYSPTNELSTNITFIIRSTTNQALSVTSWPILGTVPGPATSYTFTTPAPGIYYYSVAASNIWGVGTYASAVATPPPARTPSSLSIQFP